MAYRLWSCDHVPILIRYERINDPITKTLESTGNYGKEAELWPGTALKDPRTDETIDIHDLTKARVSPVCPTFHDVYELCNEDFSLLFPGMYIDAVVYKYGLCYKNRKRIKSDCNRSGKDLYLDTSGCLWVRSRVWSEQKQEYFNHINIIGENAIERLMIGTQKFSVQVALQAMETSK